MIDYPEETDHLNQLRAQGFTILAPLEPAEIAATNAFLLSRPVYADAHVPQTARNRIESREGRVPSYHEGRVPRDDAAASECVCVHTDDAIVAPHLLERALEAAPLAGAYLGISRAVSYSANAFYTRPGSAPLRDDIQDFHVDKDDERFLAMFVYLTDVETDEQGPQDLYGPDDVVRTICGPAGTVFLADTSRMHRGRKPTVGERGLYWWRWGVSARPPANEWDKIEPVPAEALAGRLPADPAVRESIKLLVTL